MWRGGSAHLFEVELLEPALGDGLEHVDLCGGEGLAAWWGPVELTAPPL